MGVFLVVMRYVRGTLIAAFCVVHLAILLVANIPSDARKEVREWAKLQGAKDPKTDTTPIYDKVDWAFDTTIWHGRATGALQAWGMFAPNVGSWSDTPTIVVYYVGGEEEILYSTTQPRLRNVDPGVNFLTAFPSLEERKKSGEDHLLDCNWRLHVLDARIRKVEFYVTQYDQYGLWAYRRAYIRWRLVEHLRSHPQRQGTLDHAQLYSVRYEHPALPDFGNLNPRRSSVITAVRLLADYRAAEDSDWPKNLRAGPAK